MSENTAYIKIERGSAKNFGIVFATVFLIVAAFLYISSNTIHYWALIAAVTFATVAVIKPRLLEPLNFVWFKFGMLLGAIIAPLVMMLVYFCVVTPTGLLMRMFGKDPLLLKKDASLKTYWITRKNDSNQPSSMKRQF